MANKRYYWLKLKDDFFRQKEIKKLRKVAGGDTYTIIYLKMLLLALKSDNKIYFEGVEDDFSDELALELDEESDNVKMTLAFLQSQKLIEMINEDEYLLPQCESMTGTESASAERVRRHRLKKKDNQKTLQCNTDVTNSNKNVTTETETELETDTELEIEQQQEKKDMFVVDKIKSYFNCFEESTINIITDVFLETNKDLDYLQEKIDMTKKANTNNAAGYLISALKNDYKPSIDKNVNSIQKKTGFHNFEESFTQYTPDELDEIIKKSQKQKFGS